MLRMVIFDQDDVINNIKELTTAYNGQFIEACNISYPILQTQKIQDIMHINIISANDKFILLIETNMFVKNTRHNYNFRVYNKNDSTFILINSDTDTSICHLNFTSQKLLSEE